MQAKRQQLEPDMEKRTGSKLGKESVKAIYCHPAYLTSMQTTSCEMQTTSCEMLGWMKHKIARRNINNLLCADDTRVMAESEEELKSLLMKVKEESEKTGLKLNVKKNEFLGI